MMNTHQKIQGFLDRLGELDLEIGSRLIDSLYDGTIIDTLGIEAQLNDLDKLYKNTLAVCENIDTESLCWESLTELATEFFTHIRKKDDSIIKQEFTLLMIPFAYSSKDYSSKIKYSLAEQIAELPRKLGLLEDNHNLFVSPGAFPMTAAVNIPLKMKFLEVLIKQSLKLKPNLSLLTTGEHYAEKSSSGTNFRTGFYPALLSGTYPDDSEEGNIKVLEAMENSEDLNKELTHIFEEVDEGFFFPVTTLVTAPHAIGKTHALYGLSVAKLFKEKASQQSLKCNLELKNEKDGLLLALKRIDGEYIDADKISTPTIKITMAISESIQNHFGKN